MFVIDFCVGLCQGQKTRRNFLERGRMQKRLISGNLDVRKQPILTTMKNLLHFYKMHAYYVRTREKNKCHNLNQFLIWSFHQTKRFLFLFNLSMIRYNIQFRLIDKYHDKVQLLVNSGHFLTTMPFFSRLSTISCPKSRFLNQFHILFLKVKCVVELFFGKFGLNLIFSTLVKLPVKIFATF